MQNISHFIHRHSKPIFRTFGFRITRMCAFINAGQQGTTKFRPTKPCGIIYLFI